MHVYLVPQRWHFGCHESYQLLELTPLLKPLYIIEERDYVADARYIGGAGFRICMDGFS